MHMPFSLPAIGSYDFAKLSTMALLSVSNLTNSSSTPSRDSAFKLESRPWLSSEHAFIAPGAGDVRAPCPGLNAQANHGFIKRSGKDISATSLISGLTSIYHLSTPLASAFVSGGFLCCGSVLEGLSLDALSAHNRIEHDASLVHDNAPPGAQFAPTKVNQVLVEDLITRYPSGMGINDLAESRLRRERTGKKLDPVHEELSHGEAALAWLIMKGNGTDVISVQTIREWLGHESLPHSYTIPDE